MGRNGVRRRKKMGGKNRYTLKQTIQGKGWCRWKLVVKGKMNFKVIQKLLRDRFNRSFMSSHCFQERLVNLIFL